MSDDQTFLALALRGEIVEPLSAIDDYIDRWHEEDIDVPLHEWLGMTWNEYNLFLRHPKYLRIVLDARTSGAPIEDAVATFDAGVAVVTREAAVAGAREWAKNRH